MASSRRDALRLGAIGATGAGLAMTGGHGSAAAEPAGGREPWFDVTKFGARGDGSSIRATKDFVSAGVNVYHTERLTEPVQVGDDWAGSSYSVEATDRSTSRLAGNVVIGSASAKSLPAVVARSRTSDVGV